MPATPISFTGTGKQETAAVVAGSGDFARVRLSSRANTELKLSITANGVETINLIDEERAWASGALQAGDSIKVIYESSSSNGAVEGILEVAS